MKIKNNNISRLNRLIRLLGIIILAGACQNDDRYDVPQKDSPVLVEFSVATSGISNTSGSNTDVDSRIASIYILQFNAVGNSYGTLRYVTKGTETNGGKYTATLLQSMGTNDNYKLVILANLSDYGFLYGLYGDTYDQVQKACLSAETTTPLVFDDTHPFPMFGVINGGASVQVQESAQYNGNTELIRAVSRVNLGIGTTNTAADGTVTWTKNSSTPFNMTEIQVWKAGKRYACMPALNNFHWNTADGNGSDVSHQIVMDHPSVAAGGITTVTYDDGYITNGTYCAGQIYLPEADLLWGETFDENHANRLAIIVGGNYKGSATETFYRVDFTYDEGSPSTMNILRNHIYQFTINKVEAAGYDTAELAYNSKPKNLGFEATLEPWSEQTTSVPSIRGYYMAYEGFNGEKVDWTYAAGSPLRIPQKLHYWINSYRTFNYDNFYKEGNKFYYPVIEGGQNGELYPTVADALKYEGTFPYLMVSGDDMVDELGNENLPWKTGTTLTAFDLCRNLEENGFNDWRLPRLSELAFIYLNQESLEALRGFTPMSGTYWCGSEYLEGTTDEQRKKSGSAWAVDFTTGYASWHSKTDQLKIRCVRQKLDNK